MATIQNHLIERLPSADRKRLLAMCEPVDLRLSEVLCEPGIPMRQVLFPTDGFLSLVIRAEGHAGLEVGMIGREGMLGAQLALGVAQAPMRAIVQGPGRVWQVGRVPFARELARCVSLRGMLHRYLYVLMVQLATASACRRFHGIAPRLARWLLMSHDRAQADRFHVTHEFLALMLGVRRVGVTVAAGGLQGDGLIRYHRGELSVLDRAGLEGRSCRCYADDLRIYRAHMGC